MLQCSGLAIRRLKARDPGPDQWRLIAQYLPSGYTNPTARPLARTLNRSGALVQFGAKCAVRLRTMPWFHLLLSQICFIDRGHSLTDCTT